MFFVALIIERKTVLGRKLKAVGAAELAAAASGMKVARVKVLAFALSGALAALAGVIFSIKLSGGAPSIANGSCSQLLWQFLLEVHRLREVLVELLTLWWVLRSLR